MRNQIGLGFMRHDPNNFKNTQTMVDFAMANNVNYFESCYFYLDNKCEQIVEHSLRKYPRESYELCAKMPVKGVLECRPAADIFEEQLHNLQTDYFDVYLLQAIDRGCVKILYQSNVIPYLLEQKKLGRIKKLGFSFHGTPDLLEDMLKLKCWDIVQLQLNYYDYFLSSGKQNYEIVEKYNLPIIVMGPTKGGTLINQLPEEAKQILGPEWKFYPYKFLYSLANVKLVLTGAENIYQLAENINYIKQFCCEPLTEEEWIKIEKAINIFKQHSFIQCSGCAYCQPCPVGIDIPNEFKLYNQILLNGIKDDNFKQIMESNRDNMPAFKCISCGRCEKMCPQHLPIRKLFNTHLFQMRL